MRGMALVRILGSRFSIDIDCILRRVPESLHGSSSSRDDVPHESEEMGNSQSAPMETRLLSSLLWHWR